VRHITDHGTGQHVITADSPDLLPRQTDEERSGRWRHVGPEEQHGSVREQRPEDRVVEHEELDWRAGLGENESRRWSAWGHRLR
jgi:hypothetical protein